MKALERMLIDKISTWDNERYQRLVLELASKDPDLAVALVLGQHSNTDVNEVQQETSTDGGQAQQRTETDQASTIAVEDSVSGAADGQAKRRKRRVLPESVTQLVTTTLAPIRAADPDIVHSAYRHALTNTNKQRLYALAAMAGGFDWTKSNLAGFKDFVMKHQGHYISRGYRDSRWGTRGALSKSLSLFHQKFPAELRRATPALADILDLSLSRQSPEARAEGLQ